MTGQDENALELINQAFEDCPRPLHFTDFGHCQECAEHDSLLLARMPATLHIDDLANPGWDPICFVSPAGFAYFLPGLARLALDESTNRVGWYGTQLFRHLIDDGPDNARVQHCSARQRRAIAMFVEYLIDTRAARIEAERAEDDAVRAFEIWSGSAHNKN